MERSGNFYKAIQLGYILISILIGCMAYNSLYEWQEIEALELGNKKIDELRKEINNINIQMIEFSLFGETILEWDANDLENYHSQRMVMDSILCGFKRRYLCLCHSRKRVEYHPSVVTHQTYYELIQNKKKI